jgi:hypothetical protein
MTTEGSSNAVIAKSFGRGGAQEALTGPSFVSNHPWNLCLQAAFRIPCPTDIYSKSAKWFTVTWPYIVGECDQPTSESLGFMSIFVAISTKSWGSPAIPFSNLG